MPMPADDGVSRYYWDHDTGFMMDRESNDPVIWNDQPVLWAESPFPPAEPRPYNGPKLWSISAYRLDLPIITARDIWFEADTESEAIEAFDRWATAGMARLSVTPFEPLTWEERDALSDGRAEGAAAIVRSTDG